MFLNDNFGHTISVTCPIILVTHPNNFGHGFRQPFRAAFRAAPRAAPPRASTSGTLGSPHPGQRRRHCDSALSLLCGSAPYQVPTHDPEHLLTLQGQHRLSKGDIRRQLKHNGRHGRLIGSLYIKHIPKTMRK